MSEWEPWRLLHPQNYEGDYSLPAIYELRIRYPSFGDQVVYVGETKSLERRMREHHESPNDNLRERINAVRVVARVDYSYVALPSKAAAQAQERELLNLFYRWNKKGNAPYNPPRDASLLQRVAEMGLGSAVRERLQQDTYDSNKRRR